MQGQSSPFDARSTAKEAAARAQWRPTKQQADAAAQELVTLMHEAETAADATSSEASAEGKSDRLARAHNATEHAKAANEEARQLRETSLQREDEAADLIAHLNRLESDKAAVMSICGKTKEYVARVDDALKNGAVPSSSAAAAHTLLIEEAQDVKAEEEGRGSNESATGTATGATGSTGATVEMMGATDRAATARPEDDEEY